MRRRRVAGALETFLSFPQYAELANEQTHRRLVQFADGQPLHVEVGSGRGGFLAEMAQRYPKQKFVGIELKEELLMTAVRKADRAQVDNLIFVCGYAENFNDWFNDLVIDVVYLNFVDPWPKQRHAAKRLSHSDYLKRYARHMPTGSRLILKTDNRYLYLFSVVELAKFFTVVESTHDLAAQCDPDNVKTEYERRFSDRGQQIYRIIAEV